MPTYNCCCHPFFLLWLQEASPNPGNPSAMELRIPHAKAASQYHDEHWNHCFCLQAKAPAQNCFPPDFFLCENLCFLLAVLFDTKQQCIRLHIRKFKWKLKLFAVRLLMPHKYASLISLSPSTFLIYSQISAISFLQLLWDSLSLCYILTNLVLKPQYLFSD